MTDLQKATYSGTLNIGDMSFPCSVLSNGERILTQSDFMAGMGMYYSGWVSKNKLDSATADIPHFLAFKSLEPYINKHLGDLQSIVVKYKTEKGKTAHGIKAEIIPKICEVWLDAEEYTKLGSRQKQVAKKAKLLIRALAHVGIIALVDEATGYQEIRDKTALQKILDKYLRIDQAKWAKAFPDEFFIQMFRLRGWQWKGMKVNRPSCVGHYIKDLIYKRLAPGILEELEKKNPTISGRRKHKHTQFLTEEIGHPALQQHLHAIIALMRSSTDWDKFKRAVNRAFPLLNSNIDIDFFEEE